MSNGILSCKKLFVIGYLFVAAMNTTWTRHKRQTHNSLIFDSPVCDYAQELNTYSPYNEYSEHVRKRHKKHKKKKKHDLHESHEWRSPCEETPPQAETKDPVWWDEQPILPAGYCLQNVDLHFNLDYNEPLLIVPKPKHLSQPTAIPKLKRVRLSNKSKVSELIAEPKWPNEDIIWLQNANVKPLSPLRDVALESLPTSEDIWSSYQAVKLGATPDWPLCCLQTAADSSSEPVPRTKDQDSPVSKQMCPKEQLDLAVDSIEDCTRPCQLTREHFVEETADENKAHYLEFESLELSLIEERGLLDYLKLKRLHAPLSDIKSYENLLKMARSEEGQETLREMLRAKLVKQWQLKTKHATKKPAKQKLLKQSPPKETVITQQESITVPESRASPDKTADTTPILVEVAVEELQQPTVVPIVMEQPKQLQVQPPEQQQQLPQHAEMQLSTKAAPVSDLPAIINIEILPTVSLATTTPDEAALQAWLQQFSLDLSRTVQSRIESMPNAVPDPTKGLVDFETQISQSEQPAPKSQSQPGNLQLKCTASREAPLSTNFNHVQSSNQWEETYKSRLGEIDDVIKQSAAEFRDPLSKRLRNRSVNESTGQKNAEAFKRFIVMPSLPSHLDQGLQHIRILRPPVKRKVERTSLQVDSKIVRTYSSLQLNLSLNLHTLSTKMDNAAYNSEIQVIQKRYEGAQVAWIWNNGSMLISNARSKAVLAQTESNLISLVVGIADLTQHNVQQTNVMMVTQFPWQICIDEFCQSYTLSRETVQGANRYAYYVSKSLPNVAAKVYESGAIHVFSVNAVQADSMFEKLFLLTANYRKPSKVSPHPIS